MLRNQPLEQVPVQVEDVDQAAAGASKSETAAPVGQIISDIHPSTVALDIRRIEIPRQIRVQESTRQCHLLESMIERVDGSLREIRRIESRADAADADTESAVDGALSAIIYRDDGCVIGNSAVPARNCAVQGGK